MVWKTFESEVKYKIFRGQTADIPVYQGDPPFFPLPPGKSTEVPLKYGWVIIQWNIHWEPDWIYADWISLELYKPKGSWDNPDTPLEDIPNPPSDGDEILRADECCDGELPTLGDSSLYQDYINRYWEIITPYYRLDTDWPDDYYVSDDDWWLCRKDPLNRWAGPDASGRSIHHTRFKHYEDSQWTNVGKPMPFRVAAVIESPVEEVVPRKLLVLLVIKRKGRLRLKTRPILFEIKRPKTVWPCFIATAAYGSHLSPQVKFLRHVRDKKLKQSKLGNLFVDRFEWLYYKFSPNVAKVMYRYPLFKRIMKWLLVSPIIYFLMGIFKPADLIREKIQRTNKS